MNHIYLEIDNSLIRIRSSSRIINSLVKDYQTVKAKSTGYWNIQITEDSRQEILIDYYAKTGNFCFPFSKKRPVGKVVSCYISLLFIPRNILFFHSSSIVRPEGGYVFVGRSGSGKTTVSDFFQKSKLSDDLSIVKMEADGPILLPNPFEHASWKTQFNRPIKLSKVYLLGKNRSNRIINLNMLAQIQALTYNLLGNFLNHHNHKLSKISYLNIIKMLKNVPVRKLYFDKTGEIINIL